MRLTCDKYPSLLITHPHVEFVDGVADVTDEVAATIAPVAAAFGIAIPEVEATPDTGPESAPTAPEGDSEEGDSDSVEDKPKPAPKRGPGRPPKNRG
ncbi:hypothetical protein NSA19_00945 [Actinomyces bowdenii]|uniref:hypothetical protein n=1 Tax=Actinomyces bowdenii TaxID=131109 RepID=UPI00214CBEC7|nr:hypothetical protein [Actinomyces bowdenii]MCR2051443.1 hypothetical protein [Actinomyces bowdenii]